MKQRKYFNNDRRNEMVSELKKDFKPILEKLSVPVTTFAKSNPKKTLFMMITIVIFNIIILFFFTDAFKTKEAISGSKFPEFKYGKNNEVVPNIKVSFENIRKVKAMKDTLNYLMALKQMSYQDTLTFVRVMDEFQKITSGRAGLPPVSLEGLRRSGKPLTTDTTINK